MSVNNKKADGYLSGEKELIRDLDAIQLRAVSCPLKGRL